MTFGNVKRLLIMTTLPLLVAFAIIGIGQFNTAPGPFGDWIGTTPASAQWLEASAADTAAMCRFGVAASQVAITQVNQTQQATLRAGWFVNFNAYKQPTPNGITYAPMINGRQLKTVNPSYTATYVIPYTYTINPPLDWIRQVGPTDIAKGSTWIVGNEPERRDWFDPCCGALGQNEMLPEVYATFFHDAYLAIKAADPTAQVAAAGLVEITPLRLQYYDLVLDSYRRQYGGALPADVWTIHPYANPEVAGRSADIPAGLTATLGISYPLSANADVNLLESQVRSMRQWMNSRGQGGKPLLISEFGVQVASQYADENGQFFTTARVQQYMYDSFNWLLTATDATLGDPADDNRLVQGWNWFSLGHDPSQTNGSLFDKTTGQIDPLGLGWAAYVNDPTKNFGYSVNFKMLSGVYSVGQPDASGLATATVELRLSNSGNRNFNSSVPVRLVQTSGGAYSGTVTLAGMRGCGGTSVATFVVPNLPVATFVTMHATVDPDNQTGDQNPADNSLDLTLLIPRTRLLVPMLTR